MMNIMSAEPTYLVKDLDGCAVLTEQGENLGVLKDVFSTGANDVFVVRNGDKEILIPGLKTVILNIDINSKKILVRLPDGLKDLQG